MNNRELRFRLLLYTGLFAAVVLFSSNPVAGQENSLTIQECVNIALKQNPLVLSSHQQYLAYLARVNQAKAFNQPSLSYDSDLQPQAFNFRDSGESYFGINQGIRFPGKRMLSGKIAKYEANEFRTEIKQLKLDIILQVKDAFFALLLSKEQLLYDEENLKLARDFVAKTEVKFEAGDVAKVEVLRARVEASKAANDKQQTQTQVYLTKARLNFYLAREKNAPLEIRGQLKQPVQQLNLEELQNKAFAFRPEIQKNDFALQREGLKKTLGFMSYLPDFDLGVSRHRIAGEMNTWDVSLSVPVPLFFWQAPKGEIAEAKANINSLKNETEHIKNSILLEVEESFTEAETALNQIEIFEDEIVAQAEEVYKMLLFSYQEGEISGIELIDARRTLIDAKKSYAAAQYNYAVALASLEKAIGENLEGEK